MSLGGWGDWGHGALVLPLDATNPASSTLLERADPALYATLKFLAAVIELQLGDAFRAYMLREGDKTPLSVLTSVNVEPLPALYASETRFPFFALYRKAETHAGHTLSWDKSSGEWEFAYVLPSMMPLPQNRMAPMLHAVSRVIGKAMRLGYHPLYAGGAQVLKNAGVMSARLVTTRYERYERMASAQEAVTEQFYRAIVGTVEVIERDVMVAGSFEGFTGADLSAGELDEDQPVLADVAVASADPPPVITSVTPNSGTKAGGTSVAFGGKYFRAPMRLTIGGIEVPATVVNATTLTAVTPAHAAEPTFMAEVIATRVTDSQTGRLSAGFTFTTP